MADSGQEREYFKLTLVSRITKIKTIENMETNDKTETEKNALEAEGDSVQTVVSQKTYRDREWREYAIGTKAHSFSGGYWEKVEYGWKWGGSKSRGGTFPTPGGDACGLCVELPISG